MVIRDAPHVTILNLTDELIYIHVSYIETSIIINIHRLLLCCYLRREFSGSTMTAPGKSKTSGDQPALYSNTLYHLKALKAQLH